MQSGAGFSFENVQRNLSLEQGGMKPPKTLKTGTTIVGVVYKDGVVLGADTRSTNGDVVADKQCKKIHYIAPNIMCCGAGTAADTENVTALISSKLTLHRLETRKQTRVHEALVMLKRYLHRYQGHVGAYLVLGGVDVEGPYLATIHAAGSTDRLPFVAMGSGSLNAMAALEAGYKDDMTLEEAMALAHAGITNGIFNDPFSGTQVDLCIITKDKTELKIGYDQPNHRKFPRQDIVFPKGTAPISKEHVFKLVEVAEVSTVRV